MMVDFNHMIWDRYESENGLENIKYCPICGFSGEFVSDSNRENSIKDRCPKCNSAERNRLYWIYFEKDGLLKSAKSIIHVSPDKSSRTRLSMNKDIKYRVVGCEDLANFQFEVASTDYIIANYVLDRIDNPELILKRMFRALKKGGKAMVSLYFKKTKKDDGSIVSSPESLSLALKEVGFKVSILTSEDLCGYCISKICGIRPSSFIVLAVKDE